jgi:ankyrin repeat protein
LFRAISGWKDDAHQLYVLRLLLDNGAGVHARDDTFQDTLLMRSVYLGCVQAIELLVRHGARLNAPNVLCVTHFRGACRIGDVGIIYALIRASPQFWFELSEFLEE